MTSGGGWSGGGGGGGGGFRNTIVVSTGRFLIVSATPWVALTAPKMRPAVDDQGQDRLPERPRSLLLRFDQVLEHAATSRGEDYRAREATTPLVAGQ